MLINAKKPSQHTFDAKCNKVYVTITFLRYLWATRVWLRTRRPGVRISQGAPFFSHAMFFVYVLRSHTSGRRYTGYSSDVVHRLRSSFAIHHHGSMPGNADASCKSIIN